MQTPISLNTLESKGVALNTLVNELEINFPPKLPSPKQDLSTVMYESGQRSVVEWILNRLKESDVF